MFVAAEPYTPARYVLDSLVSTHANTDTYTHTRTHVFAQKTRITQWSHWKVTQQGHKTISSSSEANCFLSVKVRMNTCSARGKCGSFSLQVDQSPTLYKDYTRCWLHKTGRDRRKTNKRIKIITLLCCISDFYCYFLRFHFTAVELIWTFSLF